MRQCLESYDLANDVRLMREQLAERARTLNASEVEIMLDFLDEVVVCYDAEVVHDFIQWRKDPRLASIMQLAVSLGDEMRDQLLFQAEDIYVSEQTRQ